MEEKKNNIGIKKILIIIAVCASILSPSSAKAESASLIIGPAIGTFSVGDTFTVSIYLNSGDNFVNAIEANLQFPPDKLQVVSPSVGKSFIEVWVGQPQYSNSEGTLSFKGAIPSPGINVSQGLISTVTFRVKSIGNAMLKFADSSKVLLNDGKGTDVLSDTNGGVYTLVLPPPAGPFVVSPTHPDQSKWYALQSAVFQWAVDLGVSSYSYVLDHESITVPDNIVEGTKNSIEYPDASNGTNYFHIKALRGSVWGGVTHYAINVDKTPPAKFGIKIEPGVLTKNTKPIIYFETTDADSGLNHYEIKIVPLFESSIATASADDGQGFFIEANSPYIPELVKGKYDVIVRAYDNAGNFLDISQRLIIGSALAVSLGIFEGSWGWLILILLLLTFTSYIYYHRWYHLHRHIELQRKAGPLSKEEISKKIRELQELQKRYQKGYATIAVLFLISICLLTPFVTMAKSTEEIPSPSITTYSKSSTNDELFYVGGKYNYSNSDIVIFIQNTDSGERYQFLTKVDKRGDWFYALDTFLSPGSYELWTQAKLDGMDSPPSAQENFTISSAVIHLGSSKISYEMIYFIIVIFLIIVITVFSLMAIVHRRMHKHKHSALVKEISDAEESVRRGFALIKRDIESELKVIHKMKMDRKLEQDEESKERILLDDLARVETEIGKEVWDIKLQS